MKQFSISIHSFADIQAFVSLSSQQPFEIAVGDSQDISGKSLMAVLGLNFRHPILVSADCDEDAFLRYRSALTKLLA